MDILFVLKSIAALVVILSILLFLFLFSAKAKKKKAEKLKVKKEQKNPKKRVEIPTLQEIRERIKDKKATSQELEDAIEALLRYHVDIPKKLGLRSHPDFDIYEEIMLRLCHHPNTNKHIIVRFERELEKRNPSYAREINDALTKGLNTRGI